MACPDTRDTIALSDGTELAVGAVADGEALVRSGDSVVGSAALVPAGTSLCGAWIAVPSGYLDEDGAAVSRATYAALFAAIAINTTADRSNTNPILINIPDTSNMRAGMPISGTGIPAATSILSVDSATQITMTNGATSTGAGGSLVVAPFGVGDGSTTFNVPDSRGKSAQGTDATDRLGADVGATSPTITDPGHAHGGVTGAASAGTFLGGGVGSVPNAPHTHTITSGATGISIADGRGPRIVKRWVIKT